MRSSVEKLKPWLLNMQNKSWTIELVGNTAFVAHGEGGLYTYDISDPFYPVELAHLPTDSAITEVGPEGPIYRGHLATKLARGGARLGHDLRRHVAWAKAPSTASPRRSRGASRRSRRSRSATVTTVTATFLNVF